MINQYFEINSSKRKYNANTVKFNGKYHGSRGSNNNGIKGYITEDIKYLNSEKTISLDEYCDNILSRENPYFTGDKIKGYVI